MFVRSTKFFLEQPPPIHISLKTCPSHSDGFQRASPEWSTYTGIATCLGWLPTEFYYAGIAVSPLGWVGYPENFTMPVSPLGWVGYPEKFTTPVSPLGWVGYPENSTTPVSPLGWVGYPENFYTRVYKFLLRVKVARLSVHFRTGG